MNYIDIVLAILILIAAVRGFLKGFVFEIASLAAIILGIWVGINFSHYASELMTVHFGWHSEYLWLISFIIIFILIVLIIHLLGNILKRILDACAMGFINKLAGMIFAILKAAFILSLVIIIFDTLDVKTHILPEIMKKESKVYEPLRTFAPGIFPFINFNHGILPELKNDDKGIKHV